jgi:hypothetical protein
MKILATILFLYCSLFTAEGIFAANTTLTTEYPSPNGSYNKVIITPQPTTNITCNAANPQNVGLLYYSGNALQLCANVNVGGVFTPTPVPANQTCFNRFCSVNAITLISCFPANPCPAGYTQAEISGTPIADSFSTTTNGNYTVFTTACCSSGSPVLPT